MTKFEYFLTWLDKQEDGLSKEYWLECEDTHDWSREVVKNDPWTYLQYAFDWEYSLRGEPFWSDLSARWINHYEIVDWKEIEKKPNVIKSEDSPIVDDKTQVNKNIDCIVSVYRMITEGGQDITTKREKDLFIEIVDLVCAYNKEEV
jgi:hypothetical protein